MRDEFNSVTYVVSNMANDGFDQKFGNHNKNQLSKCVLSVRWTSNCEQFLVHKNDEVDETCRVSSQKLAGTLQPCELVRFGELR